MIDYDKIKDSYIICNNNEEYLLFKKYFHFKIEFDEFIEYTKFPICLWLISDWIAGYRIEWNIININDLKGNFIFIKDFVRQLKLNKINE